MLLSLPPSQIFLFWSGLHIFSRRRQIKYQWPEDRESGLAVEGYIPACGIRCYIPFIITGKHLRYPAAIIETGYWIQTVIGINDDIQSWSNHLNTFHILCLQSMTSQLIESTTQRSRTQKPATCEHIERLKVYFSHFEVAANDRTLHSWSHLDIRNGRSMVSQHVVDTLIYCHIWYFSISIRSLIALFHPYKATILNRLATSLIRSPFRYRHYIPHSKVLNVPS